MAFEHVGDVSTRTADGRVVSEEDKSGLAHNPIADRAVSLWKTLANWIDARRDGSLPAAAVYVLYVAQPYEGPIADELHRCTKTDDAIELVGRLRKHFAGELQTKETITAGKSAVKKTNSATSGDESELADESPTALVKQLRRVFANDDEVIASVVTYFSIEKGTASPVNEVRSEISAHVRDEHVEEVTESLLGWTKTQVMAQIEARRVVGIPFDDFREYRLVVYERVLGKLKEFPEHTLTPQRSEIEEHLDGSNFVRQLNVLELEEEAIEAYIKDYMRASSARTSWAALGYLNPRSIGPFVEELQDHWKQSSLEVKTLDTDKTPIQRGVKLLLLCMKKETRIQKVDVPSYFSRGSFHEIANELKIGWHPDWKALVSALAK
ncbi:ABC-three component system protein [Paraburkholderia sp. BL9I2N2]|uniref:ABC-three component system protein n=1 Tax=Paraburkholderia sp. BL9I2N2 TaxID=1938809 RepID=UPI0010485C72|nr:ABC-three component system protein [Paraburkholderia sp. BL9I2N2]